MRVMSSPSESSTVALAGGSPGTAAAASAILVDVGDGGSLPLGRAQEY